MALIVAIWSGKLYEGMLGNGDVKQSSDESRIASRSAGISSHLHHDHGIGAARLDKELDYTEIGLESGRFCAGCDLLCGRCGVDVCCRNNGVRSDRKTERGRLDCWCTENTLDELSEDDRQKHHGGWTGCGVGGSFGVCGIEGVSGRECKTCDRAQNSSSQQMPWKMENCVDFPMAPQIVAVEHCKDYDVAGFPLELECLDDGQGTERQNCELERENGGECCWSEKAARNGAGSMVETLAQDWSSMDRERQYECAGGHQRMYAQLGRPCGQDGLQRNLCEGIEMPRPSMVEMETAPLERSGDRQVVWPTSTAVQNLQVGGHGCWGGVQIHWRCIRFVGICPRKHGLVAFCSKPWKLETVLEMWKDWDECSGCLADREKNREGEIWRALGTPLSGSSQVGLCSDVITVQCWSWLAGFVWQRVWTSTWLLEWKCRGRLVLRDVQNGPSELWHESVELECTIGQKLWMSEQMDCGRVGLVQVDTWARTKVVASLVALMASMVASMEWLKLRT